MMAADGHPITDLRDRQVRVDQRHAETTAIG